MNRKHIATLALTAVIAIGAQFIQFTRADANEFEPRLKALVAREAKTWIDTPAVTDAIKARNAETGGYDQARIDALDKQWRAEAKAGGGPLIKSVDDAPLSATLRERVAGSRDLFSEVFVMDAKGLNVGQSAATSDYWQGDEAKFQKSFGAGPDGLFIDEVEFDESSGAFVAQVSLAIDDPGTGRPIGAITLGVKVENLDK